MAGGYKGGTKGGAGSETVKQAPLKLHGLTERLAGASRPAQRPGDPTPPTPTKLEGNLCAPGRNSGRCAVFHQGEVLRIQHSGLRLPVRCPPCCERVITVAAECRRHRWTLRRGARSAVGKRNRWQMAGCGCSASGRLLDSDWRRGYNGRVARVQRLCLRTSHTCAGFPRIRTIWADSRTCAVIQ